MVTRTSPFWKTVPDGASAATAAMLTFSVTGKPAARSATAVASCWESTISAWFSCWTSSAVCCGGKIASIG